MKKVTGALAVIGVFVIAGAMGNDDVMVMSHVEYPFVETMKAVLVGVALIVPEIVRSIINGKKLS